MSGKNLPFAALAIISLCLRYFLSSFGHNIDFDAFFQIHYISIRDYGEPWSSGHYNYGPLWGYYCYLLNLISNHNFQLFRFFIVGTLSAVDILIAYEIGKKQKNAYILFLLNPISIIISGYHNQFDNVAILFGIYAFNYFNSGRSRKNISLYVFWMSLSLCTKHDLIFFLFWLAFRSGRKLWKIVLVFLPGLIFLLTFVPFKHAYSQIWSNVFMYKSFNNGPLYYILFFRKDFSHYLFPVFLIVMTSIGYLLRKYDSQKVLWIYLATFVAFSSSIANQYLAIAAIGLVGLGGVFAIPFLTYSFFLLVNHPDGPAIRLLGFVDSFAARYVYLPIPPLILLSLLLIQFFRKKSDCENDCPRDIGDS